MSEACEGALVPSAPASPTLALSPTSSEKSGESRCKSVTMPAGNEAAIVERVPSSKCSKSSAGAKHRNPFKMPDDNDIFLLRDKEQHKKLQHRVEQKSLKIWDKKPFGARPSVNIRNVIKSTEQDESELMTPEERDKVLQAREDQEFTMAITRDRHVEKESLNEYINKKREMFLVQYSLGVKRDEMRKLEEIAAAEEKKLELAEQYLEEDAAMFDEFLKENDRNSGDAIKVAEAETKAKLEKVAEIKRLNAQIMAIKSEISKYEDTLKEYQLYKRFLTALTPKAWLEEHQPQQVSENVNVNNVVALSSNVTASVSEKSVSPAPSSSDRLTKRRASTRAPPQPSAASGGNVNINSNTQVENRTSEAVAAETFEDLDEEPILYFTDPQQLLDIFAELEEQNLSLIQNSQETEEALEEMKQTVKNTKAKMEKETDILKEQIEKLNVAIVKEEEKAKDLSQKAKMFSFGEFKSDDQEQMLINLNKKVEDVYQSCIGDNEANISTLQMLTSIENRLEELFEQIEMMPHDKVEAAEKAKDKERRLKAREEKLEQARLQQEERVRRALERAKADTKKHTGRRLVMRSEPPQVKKHDDADAELASREEEELAYYFMP